MTRITADRAICVGAGMCALTAPAIFDQSDDGLVVLVGQPLTPAALDLARDAISLCPSGALAIEEQPDLDTTGS